MVLRRLPTALFGVACLFTVPAVAGQPPGVPLGLIGTPNGVAGLDGSGRQPLAQDAIRAWQVATAAAPVLVAAGGSWSAFLSTINLDATDGSPQAVQGGTPAPVGGKLSGLLTA